MSDTCKHEWREIGLGGLSCNKCDKPSSWYIETLARMEPDLSMIDPGAYYASAAVSLKRIADALEAKITDGGFALHRIADALEAAAKPPVDSFPIWVSNAKGVVAAFTSDAEAVAFADEKGYRVDRRK